MKPFKYQGKLNIGVAFFSIAFMTCIAFAGENQGAANIVLEGGKTGKVPFPHGQHQIAIEDCRVCHNIFPQTQGSIQLLKEEDKLRKKQVMNHCTGCHRKKKQAGDKTGPVTCRSLPRPIRNDDYAGIRIAGKPPKERKHRLSAFRLSQRSRELGCQNSQGRGL
jgi:hypothetical protein